MADLHIFNGDSQYQLARSLFPGDHLVVQRECFSEGPSASGFSEKEIKARIAWLNQAYSIAETYESYNNLSLTHQLSTLRDKLEAPIDRAIFWFDGDLFCQVNQLYALFALFYTQMMPTQGFWITWHSLAQLPVHTLHPADFHARLAQAHPLDPEQLKYLVTAGQLLSIGALPGLDLHRRHANGALAYLSWTLRLHLRRVPNAEGVNALDHYILTNAAGQTPSAFLQQALEEMADYGLGDLQWQYLIRCLQEEGLVTLQDGIYDTQPNGKPKHPFYLGNYIWRPTAKFYWDDATDAIVLPIGPR